MSLNFVEELETLIHDRSIWMTQHPNDEEYETIRIKTAGNREALRIYLEHYVDNLMIGEIYYVVNYANGNKANPFIERMKLFRIAKYSNGRDRYYFTYALKNNEWLARKTDIVLGSKAAIRKRVFFTQKEAEEAIGIVG